MQGQNIYLEFPAKGVFFFSLPPSIVTFTLQTELNNKYAVFQKAYFIIKEILHVEHELCIL